MSAVVRTDGDWNPGLTRVFSAVAPGYSPCLQDKGLKLAKCSLFLPSPASAQDTSFLALSYLLALGSVSYAQGLAGLPGMFLSLLYLFACLTWTGTREAVHRWAVT